MNEPIPKGIKRSEKGVESLFQLNPLNGQPIITVDYEAFEPLLEDQDLTASQKQEFLQAIWNIVVAFVDYGFEVHPIQLALNDGGKLGKTDTEHRFSRDIVLPSENTKLASKYKCATKQEGGSA